MQTIIPTTETLSRIDGGRQFIEWIEPRLAGDSEDRETALVMIMAQMSARYAQGLHDAAEVLRRISESKPESRDLAIAANAIAEMERRARLDPVTSI